MANCRKCGEPVEEDQKICEECAAEQQRVIDEQKKKNTIMWASVGGVVVLIVLGAIFMMHSSPPPTVTEEDKPAAKTGEKTYTGDTPAWTPKAVTPMTQGKWNVTKDDRGAYLVNGMKLMANWTLKDEKNNRFQFLSPDEKKSLSDALNEFDKVNK